MKCEAQDVPDPLETADLNAEVFSDTVHEICDFNEFYTVYMGMQRRQPGFGIFDHRMPDAV